MAPTACSVLTQLKYQHPLLQEHLCCHILKSAIHVIQGKAYAKSLRETGEQARSTACLGVPLLCVLTLVNPVPRVVAIIPRH